MSWDTLLLVSAIALAFAIRQFLPECLADRQSDRFVLYIGLACRIEIRPRAKDCAFPPGWPRKRLFAYIVLVAMHHDPMPLIR